MNQNTTETRRRFFSHLASLGLGAALLPEILRAQQRDLPPPGGAITKEMVANALKVSGLEFSDSECEKLVHTANRMLASYADVRKVDIPNEVSTPSHFSALVPGMTVNRQKLPFRLSKVPPVKRPANLEDVAFWPIRNLGELIRTRQVTSVELTRMYLGRLHRYNPLLNFVVTFLDDPGLEQARQADSEIAAGKYRGALHGIPWGAKDIISAKGYKTTWGSAAFKDQVFDYDATVVELLRDAGAVLIAKVSTGELAHGDQWFGGRTMNPWNPKEGSSGSSAGPASATAAGCIAFGVGTETQGSILSPSRVCGLTGLRPTLGRVSRHGVMTVSWSYDRVGPLCRHVEDCAIIMQAIARPDNQDLSVSEIPFNWDARMDVKKLRIGIIEGSFEGVRDPAAQANARKTLEIFKSLGIERFVPLEIPEHLPDVGTFEVEFGAFFEQWIASGQDNALTRTRFNTELRDYYLIPAVDYVRSQRVRMMAMMKLAEATKAVDAYVVGPGGQIGAGINGPVSRHDRMANMACYPALNMPNGFSDGEIPTPTGFTIFSRPFGETELLALGKAYQDAAGYASRHPELG